MADALPDYRFERMRLERQQRQIQITVLDQKVQHIDLQAERDRLREAQKELGEAVDASTKQRDEGQDTERGRLAAELAVQRKELAVFDVDLRLAEIEGVESRLVTNIEASDRALADLKKQIAAMKD